jgi:hypothetical protein
MPRFNIDSFRAQFQGGARAYLFYMKPGFPASVPIDVEKTVYLVRSTTVPDQSIDEIPLNWQGHEYKIPGKYTYTDWTCTFYLDIDAKVQEAYYNWQRQIHDPTTNIYADVPSILADQSMELLSYTGDPIARYKLVGAWPKMIGQISLDYMNNEVATFDVTFAYVYHVMDKIKYGNTPTFG